MAQIVYYFYAAVRLGGPDRAVAFSVPTGNFGDVFAGYVAAQMGLPIARLVVATNVNDILHRALTSGDYSAGTVTPTATPSMDIQVSSNFERLLFDLAGRDGAAITAMMGEFDTDRAMTIPADMLAGARDLFASASIDGDTMALALRWAQERGGQVIDLEALANHRGSLFGHRPGGQPSQKAFEGRLAVALAALDPARPVVVEAESSRIGDLGLPKGLWAAMTAAPRIHVRAPLEARAAYLARAYGDLADDPARLATVIDRLRPSHSAEVVETWLGLAASGETGALAADLMRRHYDPRYEKHRARYARPEDPEVRVDDLSPGALPGLADRIAAALSGLAAR